MCTHSNCRRHEYREDVFTLFYGGTLIGVPLLDCLDLCLLGLGTYAQTLATPFLLGATVMLVLLQNNIQRWVGTESKSRVSQHAVLVVALPPEYYSFNQCTSCGQWRSYQVCRRCNCIGVHGPQRSRRCATEMVVMVVRI